MEEPLCEETRSSAEEQTVLRQREEIDRFFRFQEPEKARKILAVYPAGENFPFSHLIVKNKDRGGKLEAVKSLVKRSIEAGLATEEERGMLGDGMFEMYVDFCLRPEGVCELSSDKIVVREQLWRINPPPEGFEFIVLHISNHHGFHSTEIIVRNALMGKIVAKISLPHTPSTTFIPPFYISVYRGYLLFFTARNVYLVGLFDPNPEKTNADANAWEQSFSIRLIPEASLTETAQWPPRGPQENNSYLVDNCTGVPSIVKIRPDGISRYGDILPPTEDEGQGKTTFRLEEIFSFSDPTLDYVRLVSSYTLGPYLFGNPGGAIDSKGRIWFTNRNAEMVILTADFSLLAKIGRVHNYLYVSHGDDIWVGTAGREEEKFFRLVYLQ